MRRTAARFTVQSALIAAAYAALTWLSAAMNLAYGPVQFRLSEALNMLAMFTPAAVPGLTLGCLVANLGSPYGAIDVIAGTLATLLSALGVYFVSRRIKKFGQFTAPLFPTVLNALAVGGEIALFLPAGERGAGFMLSVLQVGAGEAAVCFLLGLPLYYLFAKRFPSLFG